MMEDCYALGPLGFFWRSTLYSRRTGADLQNAVAGRGEGGTGGRGLE